MQMPRNSATVERSGRARIAAAREFGHAPAGEEVSLRVPWMPTRQAIASWPASVSRQPRPAQRQRSPSNETHREVADLAGEPRGRGRSRRRRSRRRRCRRCRRSEAVTDAAQRAALELAECSEIGVVAEPAEAGVAERFAQALDDRQLIPAEVGRVDRRACLGLDRPRGPRCPRRSGSARAVALAQRLATSSASSSKASVGELVRLSCPTAVRKRTHRAGRTRRRRRSRR